MGFSVTDGGVILTGTVDIDDAADLQKALIELGKSGSSKISVDAAGVEDVDISILQLLYVALSTFKKTDQSLTINNPSTAFRRRRFQSGSFLPI